MTSTRRRRFGVRTDCSASISLRRRRFLTLTIDQSSLRARQSSNISHPASRLPTVEAIRYRPSGARRDGPTTALLVQIAPQSLCIWATISGRIAPSDRIASSARSTNVSPRFSVSVDTEAVQEAPHENHRPVGSGIIGGVRLNAIGGVRLNANVVGFLKLGEVRR